MRPFPKARSEQPNPAGKSYLKGGKIMKILSFLFTLILFAAMNSSPLSAAEKEKRAMQKPVVVSPFVEAVGIIESYSPAREPMMFRAAGMDKAMVLHWDENSVVVDANGNRVELSELKPGQPARVIYAKVPEREATISRVIVAPSTPPEGAVALPAISPSLVAPTSAVDGDITTQPPDAAAVDGDRTTVPAKTDANADGDITTSRD
jgi:hypothetical protein